MPHRASTSEDPIAPFGPSSQDSTHIADDVITVGITHGILRLEASGFHGREPDEFRWDMTAAKSIPGPASNGEYRAELGRPVFDRRSDQPGSFVSE